LGFSPESFPFLQEIGEIRPFFYKPNHESFNVDSKISFQSPPERINGLTFLNFEK